MFVWTMKENEKKVLENGRHWLWDFQEQMRYRLVKLVNKKIFVFNLFNLILLCHLHIRS